MKNYAPGCTTALPEAPLHLLTLRQAGIKWAAMAERVQSSCPLAGRRGKGEESGWAVYICLHRRTARWTPLNDGDADDGALEVDGMG